MPKQANSPWERQKGESEKAYEAFVIYRDMGADRTITAVAKKLTKSRTLIGRWSAQWNWQERVLAYDNELQREAKAEAAKDYKEMMKRHIGMAVAIQKKAYDALKELDIDEMSPRDIREYIKMATDLERLNRELTVSHNQDDDDVIVPIFEGESELED